MFSWLRAIKPAATWNVSPSPDHTYDVFADTDLEATIASALGDLDATLVAASRKVRADLAAEVPGDENLIDAFDEDGKLRTLIAGAVTVEPVDADAARTASVERAAFANATHAMRVRLRATDRVDALVPYALVAVAAAIARRTSGSVYDTLGRRVLPEALVANPLAGLALGSAGAHVAIVPSAGADDTLRFTTLGLRKYGLFEVTLGGVPASLPRASDIVAAFVQSTIDPMPPLAPGPWKAEKEYVSAFGVRAFFNADGPDASKPDFTALSAQPGNDSAAPWTIVDERLRPLDSGSIAAILGRFDADRAAAIREAAVVPT